MKIKKFSLYVLVVLLLLCIYYLNIEPLYTPTALNTPNEKYLLPRYIAHKSIISGETKGNSKEAIMEALKAPVEGIELDVRLSKDKIPFIYHADELPDFLGGGRPEDKNWSELKSITLSLEEVFEMVGNEKYLFLDIKEKGILNNGFADKINTLVVKYKNNPTVIVESLNPIFLTHMRLSSRDVIIMYDFVTDATAIGEEAQSQFDSIPWILKVPFVQKQFRRILRPDIVGPRWNVDGYYLQDLIASGYPIITWTVDDVNVASKLFSLGVTGLQSNRIMTIMENINLEFPNKIMDAGGTESYVEETIYVTKIDQVQQAIKKAKEKNLKISIAGKRHSMGGQSLLSGGIHLNMLGLNKVQYDPNTKRVTAEAGASWKKIQEVLDKYQRSVKVMQSDNIFSIGGSVSVNVHGWQVGVPPLSSTIYSLSVMTAEGDIKKISLDNDPDFFRAVMGGYGQLAVILAVELETTENNLLKANHAIFPTDEFENKFKQFVSNNQNVELAYGRLSVDSNHLLSETLLNWFEKESTPVNSPLQSENFIAIKRSIFRFSEYFDIGKRFRWVAEKRLAKELKNSVFSRNSIMNTDIHILWPIKSGNIDILQEYFIPKAKFNAFIKKLQFHLQNHSVNLLNATIREVQKDTLTVLSYAKEDCFAIVLLFSQPNDGMGEFTMEQFTIGIIKAVLELQGTFYLPYRPHYTHEELIQAYPNFDYWLSLKKKVDPNTLFYSQFMGGIITHKPSL